MRALRDRGNHGVAGGVGGPPGPAAIPELEVERRARHRALDPAPGVLDVGSHDLWHGLAGIRSEPAQDPLGSDYAEKPCPDCRPARPKSPAPTAHWIMDVIELHREKHIGPLESQGRGATLASLRRPNLPCWWYSPKEPLIPTVAHVVVPEG